MRLSWNRRVVPSWDISRSNHLHFVAPEKTENSTLPEAAFTDVSLVTKAVAEFDALPTLGLASDVLRFSSIVSRDDRRLDSAATYVLRQPERCPEALRRTALAVLNGARATLPINDIDLGASGADATNSIRRLRAWLRSYSRDGLAWSDLARLLAARGNNEGANRAIATALYLYPNSRLILRNATRFHLHNKDPERALALLHRHERTRTDPWLMAGHIAVSSIVGRESKLLKRGRQLIESKTLSANDSTELASSLATIELQAGANRAAKKLFNVSLLSPNQNTLAQIEWASKQLKLIPDLPQKWFEAVGSAEAGYYRSITGGDFSTALDRSLAWAEYEPFASRPLIAASFLSSIKANYNDAVAYAQRGLISEPEDTTLLNNLLFASANDSEVHDLNQIVRRILALERNDPSPQTLANLGMLAYLSDDFANGELFYGAALAKARRLNQNELAANCLSFQAFYAMQRCAPNAEAIQESARSAVKAASTSLSNAVFEHLFAPDTNLEKKPLPLRSPLPAWKYDPKANTLVLEGRIPVR